MKIKNISKQKYKPKNMFKKYFNPIFLESLFKEKRVCKFAPTDADAPTPTASAEPEPDPVAAAPDPDALRAARTHATTTETRAGLTSEQARNKRDLLQQQVEKRKKAAELPGDKIAKAVREKRIAPETWDPKTEEGLKQLVHDLEIEIGLEPNDVKWMEDELKYAFDQEVWKTPNDPNRQLFLFPENNLGKIGTIRPGYQFAYTYFLAVQNIALESVDSHSKIDESNRSQGRDSGFEKATDLISEKTSEILDAVEERDYSKLALYAVAGYSFYKIFKNIKDSSSEGAKAFKKFALYGTAAYCGLALFAPDYLDKIKGRGIDEDIKDTSFATFEGLMQRDPEWAKRGIDIGLMAALQDAPVKELFGTIVPGSPTYEPDATALGMVHLDNPIFSGFIPKSLRGMRPPAGNGPFSAEEKVYRATSKRLFSTLKGMMFMYDHNTFSKDKTTFKAKYIDVDGGYVLHDVVTLLAQHEANYNPMPWSAELLKVARNDLTGSNGLFNKKNEGVWIQSNAKGNNLKGTVRGFPVVIKMNQTPTGKEYWFYLANEADSGAYPIAKYEVDNEDSGVMCKDALFDSIQSRMNELLASVLTTDPKTNIRFKDNGWTGSILMPANKEYGLDPTPLQVDAKVYSDGRAVSVNYKGSKYPIVIDEMMAQDNYYAPFILNKIMKQKEFNALNVFHADRRVEFKDLEGDETGRFELIIRGADSTLLMQYNKTSGEFQSLGGEEGLVQNEGFRRAYVEAYSRQDFAPVFDEMKQTLANMDESFFLYFWEGAAGMFKDPKIDKWIDPSMDMLGGSIKDNYTKMLITTQQLALESHLYNVLGDADSLADIEEQKKKVGDRLNKMVAACKSMKTAEHASDRDSWGRTEFILKIIEPIRSAGADSLEYGSALKTFEGRMVNNLGLAGSDWNENKHLVMAELYGAFYSFTVHLDNRDLDKYGTIEEKENSNQHAQYFDYVSREIIAMSKPELAAHGNMVENIPDIGRFKSKIDDFDTWKVYGLKTALLAIDNEDPFSNELEDGETRTELEGLFATRFEGVVKSILDNASDSVNEAFLVQRLANELGVKQGYEYELGENAPLKDYRERPIFNKYATAAARFQKRTPQLDYVEIAARKFLNDLIEDPKLWKPGILPDIRKKAGMLWREEITLRDVEI